MCVTVTEVVKTWRPESVRKKDEEGEWSICPECHGEICDNCRKFKETGLCAICDDGTMASYLYRTKKFYVTLEGCVGDRWTLIDSNWCWDTSHKAAKQGRKLEPLDYKRFLQVSKKFAMTVIWSMDASCPGFVQSLRDE
jgi:hypothetical protein